MNELDARIGAWVAQARRYRRSPPELPALLAGWQVELKALNLARSGFVDDYTLCLDGTCRPLAIWLPGLGPVGDVQLTSC